MSEFEVSQTRSIIKERCDEKYKESSDELEEVTLDELKDAIKSEDGDVLNPLDKVSFKNINFCPPNDGKTKNFISNYNEIVWISYEGSAIVSALIAVADGTTLIKIYQLPEVDREIIYSILKYRFKFLPEQDVSFFVSFDKHKNFEFKKVDKEQYTFSIGNRIASIPPDEASSFGGANVKVERKGKEIVIGNKIKLDRNRIQSLTQTSETNSSTKNVNNAPPMRTKVSGRNPYELRSDIVENAIDIVKLASVESYDDCDTITTEILKIADRLYAFVEHKQ
jgi:translation elongation factor P/translation initiation factor 5A